MVDQAIYFYYYTDTMVYLIYEYDGEDIIFGIALSAVFPMERYA